MVELLVRTEQFFAHEFLRQVRPLPGRARTGWRTSWQRIAAGRGQEKDLKLLLEVAGNMGGLPFHQRTLCALADFAAGAGALGDPAVPGGLRVPHPGAASAPSSAQLVHA